MHREDQSEVKIGGKFIKGSKIGSGAFGEVFAGNSNTVNVNQG